VLLTRELAALGYRTTLLTGVCEAGEGDMGYVLKADDDVNWIPEMSRSVRPWKNICALARMWRLIRAERPDIVHTHTAMAGCLGRVAALVAGVPILVHTFHGNSLRGYFAPFVESVFRRVERLLGRFTDIVCVISEQQLSELTADLKIVSPASCRLVPLGLDLSSFVAITPPDPHKRPLRVGWFGRLVPVKDIPLLVRIVEATLERTAEVEFHIAGDGSERGLILEAVERFGPRLVWHGWRKDIKPLLDDCHVLIQTSRNEGTPVALIQGMAAGRPFVSTAAGGLVDMVDRPALRTTPGCSWFRNAALVSPNPEAFATALLELLRNPEMLAEMGREAQAFASFRYRKEALVSSLDSLYRELISERLRRRTLPERDPELLAVED